MDTFKEPLTPEEETYYFERYALGDIEAKNKLIEHNLRLVAHIVKKYNQPEKNVEDLISIGTIGLIKAVNTFNSKIGNRLVTYASRCIENELLMYFRSEKKKQREVSIQEPIGTDKEGNEISLIDILESENGDYVEHIENKENILWICKNISKVLDEREMYIISKRYGITDGIEMPQRQLAAELNISRSYVSRIEKKALNKLKEALLTNSTEIY